jgi:hypothetical protein
MRAREDSMIQSRPAVAISCGVLILAALVATSYYVRSQEKKVQQATIQSGVVLLPGETLVAPADPLVTGAPAAAAAAEPVSVPVKSKPAPTSPGYKKQPSTPHYTRDEVLKSR